MLLLTLANPQENISSSTNNILQFLTVAVIFILVLVLTAVTTKWIARYQKGQIGCRNIEVIETYRITNNKYIQVVRIGETYLAIAIGKDTVTMLKEIPKEQIQQIEKGEAVPGSFKAMLEKAQILKSGKNDGPKEE